MHNKFTLRSIDMNNFIRAIKLNSYTKDRKLSNAAGTVFLLIGAVVQFTDTLLFGDCSETMISFVGGGLAILGVFLKLCGLRQYEFSGMTMSSSFRRYLRISFPAALTFLSMEAALIIVALSGSLAVIFNPAGVTNVCISMISTVLYAAAITGFAAVIYKLPFWIFFAACLLGGVFNECITGIFGKCLEILSGGSILLTFIGCTAAAGVSAAIVRTVCSLMYKKENSSSWKKCFEGAKSII